MAGLQSPRLRELASLFLRLGFSAFGGPAAHIAMMEDEVVRRRAWIDRQRFLDLVAALNFVPGPNSTELAINLGLIRAGMPGMVVAGICFILPAVLIILPIAWAYVRFGSLPALHGAMSGVSSAVVAIVLVAGMRFCRTAAKDGFTRGIVVLAIFLEWLLRYALRRHLPHVQAELIVLSIAGVAGAIWYAKPTLSFAPPLLTLQCAHGLILATVTSGQARGKDLMRLVLFFLKVGATLFGSGYVLASYLQGGLVEQNRWLTSQELLDSIAVGQTTPGPLLTTATFVGYLRGHSIYGTTWGGVAGALLSTGAIFLPAFCFIAVAGPYLSRLRANKFARGALDGMNAAVVSLIFVVAARFAIDLWPSGLRLCLALAALIVLLRWRINATWIMLAAAAVGFVSHYR